MTDNDKIKIIELVYFIKNNINQIKKETWSYEHEPCDEILENVNEIIAIYKNQELLNFKTK